MPRVQKRALATLNYAFDLSPSVTGETTNPWAPPESIQLPWLSPGEEVIHLTVTVAPSTPGALNDLVVDLTTIGANASNVPSSLITAWLSGGTAGQSYVVTFLWTTNSTPLPRVDDRQMLVVCIA